MENWRNNPIIKGYMHSNNFGILLGMEFEIVSPGEIYYRMPITEGLLATPLAAHGGSISALMDATMGVAALSKVYLENRVVSTIEMKISFLKPALLGDLLTATARVIKEGRSVVFVEGEMKNQHGQLVAFGTGTFNPYPAEKAGF